MPSGAAYNTLPRFAATIGRVDDAREVEPEVGLAIDFLALVDVGPLVRERRLDGRVREGMEDGAAPQDLRRRSGPAKLAIFSAFFRRSSPFTTRNFSQDVSLRVHLGRRLEDRRHDAVEERVVELDAALLERLGERQAIEVGARRVAGLVLRDRRTSAC